MQSYFEVNVTLNGQHFFATAERSITDSDKAKHVVLELLKRFPKSDGFQVSVSYEKCIGISHYGTELTRTNFLGIINELNK